MRVAARAPSGGVEELAAFWDSRVRGVDWERISMPAVKPFGPAPDKRIVRVEESWERWSKTVRSSSHMLGRGE